MLKKIIILSFVLILSVTIVSGAEEPFYEGNTITLICPHGAGGGFDTYSRMIKPFLEKYLPGSTVVVKNATGAGGAIGRNQAYMADSDGLTIALSAGDDMVYNTISGSEAVKYDLTKFTYLARITTEPSILNVPAKSDFENIEDLINANKELTFSCSGVGDADYFALGIEGNAFGFDIMPVTGYAGSKEASMAAVRGEVDMWQASLSSSLSLIRNDDVRPVLVIGMDNVDSFPEVPTAIEAIKRINPDKESLIRAVVNINEVRRVAMAPPGLDEEKTEILREAFKKALNDPELIEQSKKIDRPISYLNGEKIKEMMIETMQVKDEIKPLLEECLKLAQ